MFKVCPLCNEWKALSRHHMFENTKTNKKYYTKKELDHPTNIFWCCLGCHLNKVIPRHNEKQFCALQGIKPRSKSGLL